MTLGFQSLGGLDLEACLRAHGISRDSLDSSSSSGESNFDDEYYRNRPPLPEIDYSNTIIISVNNGNNNARRFASTLASMQKQPPAVTASTGAQNDYSSDRNAEINTPVLNNGNESVPVHSKTLSNIQNNLYPGAQPDPKNLGTVRKTKRRKPKSKHRGGSRFPSNDHSTNEVSHRGGNHMLVDGSQKTAKPNFNEEISAPVRQLKHKIFVINSQDQSEHSMQKQPSALHSVADIQIMESKYDNHRKISERTPSVTEIKCDQTNYRSNVNTKPKNFGNVADLHVTGSSQICTAADNPSASNQGYLLPSPHHRAIKMNPNLMNFGKAVCSTASTTGVAVELSASSQADLLANSHDTTINIKPDPMSISSAIDLEKAISSHVWTTGVNPSVIGQPVAFSFDEPRKTSQREGHLLPTPHSSIPDNSTQKRIPKPRSNNTRNNSVSNLKNFGNTACLHKAGCSTVSTTGVPADPSASSQADLLPNSHDTTINIKPDPMSMNSVIDLEKAISSQVWTTGVNPSVIGQPVAFPFDLPRKTSQRKGHLLPTPHSSIPDNSTQKRIPKPRSNNTRNKSVSNSSRPRATDNGTFTESTPADPTSYYYSPNEYVPPVITDPPTLVSSENLNSTNIDHDQENEFMVEDNDGTCWSCCFH